MPNKGKNVILWFLIFYTFRKCIGLRGFLFIWSAFESSLEHTYIKHKNYVYATYSDLQGLLR